jgi:hypothetical protein
MAQREIGIKPNLTLLRTAPFIDTFYGGAAFGFTAHAFQNRPVFYTNIWKSAHTAIRVSMYVHARGVSPDKGFCPKGGRTCAVEDFDHLEEEYDSVAQQYTAMTNQSIQTFSFIRKPVSHFLAGLKEYMYLKHQHAHPAASSANKTVTPSDLAHFLHAFLDVTSPAPEGVFSKEAHGSTIPYVFPQATSFREKYGKHLIGRIENFAEDWRKIQEEFGINVPIKKEYGLRESSKDVAHVGISWGRLMSARPQYLRALCWLLLPDFLCFNYQLPSQCEDIVFHMHYAYLQ